MLDFDPTRIEAKREGRDVLAQYAGIPLEEAADYFVTATHQNFRSSFNAFTSQFPEAAKKISDARPDGVGPGEMVAWFVFDNLTLGGKNSSMDLVVDGEPFAEMKGGTHTKKTNTLDNFKITKDTDLAVTVLQSDLIAFNEMYNAITGSDLPGWNGSTSIRLSALSFWKTLNLTQLQKITPAPVRRKYIAVDPDGTILNMDETAAIGNVSDADVCVKLQKILAEEVKISIDSNVDTLDKIIQRWKKQAMIDYVGQKPFALVNTKNLHMHFYGTIPESMLSLYCVHRNQPWARILLDQLPQP